MVGLGFGVKTTEGKAVDFNSLRVYVRRKKLKKNLSRAHRIPSQINGMPTDVIELSPVRPQAVVGGNSCSHFRVGGGTIGCLVSVAGEIYVLSNNHVLADCNRGNIGDEVWQPAGSNTPLFARLSDFVSLDFNGGSNLMDAAIARLEDTTAASPEIESIGRLNPAVATAESGDKVTKYGSKSLQTYGTIDGVSEDCSPYFFGKGRGYFTKQIAVLGRDRKFSEKGDSGALVVRAADNAAIGILFAAGKIERRTEVLTFVCPLDRILEHFRASLVI